MRIRRALGDDVEEAILLDALRRGELADRAAIEEAEETLPARREALERVIDEPIREVSVTIDQDSWPADVAGVIEIALNIDIYVGSMSILLAPTSRATRGDRTRESMSGRPMRSSRPASHGSTRGCSGPAGP